MTEAHEAPALNACIVRIGSEVFAIYGDDTHGWSVDPPDLDPQMPMGFRYQTLDELFFALVNMNLSVEGRA